MFRAVVIDDEYFTRKSLIASGLWEVHGFEIVGEAECGVTGLEMIETLKPHLAFVDINMPNLDGISMVQRLRETDKETVIVMLTGYSDFEHVQGSLRAQANDYLLKPMQEGELNECLRTISDNLSSLQVGMSNDVRDKKDYLIEEITNLVEQHYCECTFSIDKICEALNYNYHYISKVFKEKKGESLGKYIFGYRMEKAKEMIEQGECFMSSVAAGVGYEDELYFMKCFKRHYGKTPSQYIKMKKKKP